METGLGTYNGVVDGRSDEWSWSQDLMTSGKGKVTILIAN